MLSTRVTREVRAKKTRALFFSSSAQELKKNKIMLISMHPQDVNFTVATSLDEHF